MPSMYSVAPATFEQARRAREESDLVEHRGNFLTHRDRDDLAAVLRFDGDKLLGVRLDEVGDLQECASCAATESFASTT